MSFGIGIGDVVCVANLLTTLIERVRNGPQEFREFTNDLLLAQTCISQIKAHQNTFYSRTSKLDQLDRETTSAVFRDIRYGLEELQGELNTYNAKGSIGRVTDDVIMGRQKDLREKLQFQFSKLGILYQSFSLAQGARMAEALHEIREARPQDDEDTLVAESIAGFRKKYPKRDDGSSYAGTAPSTIGDPKERFVRQWVSEVEKFENGTFVDGFSDLDWAKEQEMEIQLPDASPPARAFLWQFMLWDIRRRENVVSRWFALAVGLIFPALMLVLSLGLSPFLIWASLSKNSKTDPTTIQVVANVFLLISSSVICYSSSLRKHSGITCSWLARLACFLAIPCCVLVLASGIWDMKYQIENVGSGAPKTFHFVPRIVKARIIAACVYSVLYFIALVGALIYSGVCSSRWQPTQLQGAEAPARPTQQQQIEAPAHPTKEEEIEVPAKS